MLVGQSPPMKDLRGRIARVAGTHFTVLIEGESGAGKELVARELHQASPRRGGPFVAVNCAALVESLLEAELFGIEERAATGVRGRRGRFELADHGTLFLDEIADLSHAAQAKLLRVLQDFIVERVGGLYSHRVDLRIVAATNRDLKQLAAEGRFRADLYYRISGVEILVPPLRERRSDIPLLIDHFMARHARAQLLALAPEAMEALVAYDWPGNVRQLARVVERVVALSAGSVIQLGDLPREIVTPYAETTEPLAGADLTLRDWSRRYARLVLDRCKGNKRKACEVLGITYNTLNAYLDQAAQHDAAPHAGQAIEVLAQVREQAS